ncbi:hypothetical protein BH10ACI4_BH10ACI4_37080 [soil metagenome]
MIHAPSVRLRCVSLLVSSLGLGLSGCGGKLASTTPVAVGQLRGTLHGGQQPVVGAKVQLYAAGTTGCGSSATALLSTPVITDAGGGFTITGQYACPSSSSQLYIVATGGNPGLAPGTENPALALMTALGPCSLHGGQYTLDPNSFLSINEVTTVASVYALAPFMGADAAHIGASSTNAIGLANAFRLVKNLVDTTAGTALAATPAGNGVAPQTATNTLGNILASCVNSDGAGSPCTALFTAATPAGGTAPQDTIQATINIVRNPIHNVTTLYGLAGAIAPFQPTLPDVPNDWILAVTYSAPGLAGTSMAIDASGHAWIANSPYGGPYSVTELDSDGAVLSGANGYTGGGLSLPTSIAIDPSGNAWVTGTGNGNVVKFSSSGTVLSGANGYTGGGLSLPESIALDGQGNAWVVDVGGDNTTGNHLIKLDANGAILSGATGIPTGGSHPLLGLSGVGIDRAGNAWVGNANEQTVAKFSNDGTLLSGSGYALPGLYPITVAFDAAGDAWVNSLNVPNFGKLDSTGSQLSPSGGYKNCTAPGLVGNLIVSCFWWSPAAFAIDGAGNVWAESAIETKVNGRVPNPTYTYAVSELTPSGTVVSGSIGYTGGASRTARAIAVDGSGNVWILATNGTVTEFVGAATPVVTPFSTGVLNGTLGSWP